MTQSMDQTSLMFTYFSSIICGKDKLFSIKLPNGLPMAPPLKGFYSIHVSMCILCCCAALLVLKYSGRPCIIALLLMHVRFASFNLEPTVALEAVVGCTSYKLPFLTVHCWCIEIQFFLY